jgi:hypothetical protein
VICHAQKAKRPTREGEGVECQLAGDIDTHSAAVVRLQFLVRRGLSLDRAALKGGLVFGEVIQ